MSWYQAEVNRPGRVKEVELRLLDGVVLTRISNRSVNEMLMAGDLDAATSARPPWGFFEKASSTVLPLRKPRRLERAHREEAGIFPIVRVLVRRLPPAKLIPGSWASS